jgi:hypothetical protein
MQSTQAVFSIAGQYATLYAPINYPATVALIVQRSGHPAYQRL